jgi:hypothetical protein
VKLNMSSTERRNTMTSVFPGVAPVNERVAIVVGAGGELGRATAEKLAAAGFTVAGSTGAKRR